MKHYQARKRERDPERDIKMELTQVIRMNGGMGETSYANNSWVQQKVISLTKSIREEAITCLYRGTLPRSVVIADLGCSSGPNTLSVVSEVIKSVEKICQELNHQSPEYQILLNDLPGNDFNSIFMSLDSFKEKLRNEMVAGIGPCFFTGVPGSFYGRLFLTKSLHFIHSSYSLQWLSQVPEGIENNKGNICIASTSPPNVQKAYYEQFQRDFSLFLKCRAEEMNEGGHMVLTLLGRKSDDPSSKEGCYIWEILAMALNDMVMEGIVEEEQLDSFNIPNYAPLPSEVKLEVQKEGSFSIKRLETSEVYWNSYDINCNPHDDYEFGLSKTHTSDGGYNLVKCMRAVAEPLLASHFGDAIMEDVFGRFQKNLSDHMSKEKIKFVNVTVSMTRRS